MTSLEELKQRAKQGDRGAVQELRERGFFRDKRALQTGYEISSAQRRIWVLEQMDSAAAAYNMPAALLLEGHVNTTTLRDALSGLVDRHESLRTTFVTVDGSPRQFVGEQADVPWQELDLRREADPQREAQCHARQHANAVFDLARGPLLSARLLRLADNRWVLLFNVHHIVCDEWSLQVMARELMALYDAAVHGRDAELRPLHIQYKDYAAWQNQQLAAPECRIHRDYWVNKLGGELSSLELPADFSRPANKTFAGGTLSLPLPAELSDGLQRLGWRHGSSLFMTLTALVKVLLFRYTAAEDIVVGTPYAGRDQAEFQDQIGFFVNTLVLRDRLQGTDGFADVLEQVKTTVLEAFEHQIYPFDRLLEDLQVPRDLSRTPLFGVMVVLQHGGAGLQLGDVRAAPFDSGYQVAKFDLTFEFAETPAGIQLGLNYNTDLFRERTVQRMLTHFAQLAASAVAHPDTGIGELELLAPDEERKLIFEFNDTAADYPREKTIADLFEAEVAAAPDNPAVIFGDVELSYRELNRQANQLAWQLIDAHGVRPGQLIAVCLDRSEQVIVAFLGILKAGAAYVPLDPEYPDARLQSMLADSRCQMVLTKPRYREQVERCLPETERPTIAELSAAAIPAAAVPPPRPIAPDHPAYVIYTSGSTGRPKGCVVTHRNVVRLMKNSRQPFDFGPGDIWVVAHSFCFDFSVWEMYGALLYGGRVVVAPRDDVRDVHAFRRLLRRHCVTVLNQTPAAFYNLIEAEAAARQHDLHEHLRYVIFGGDCLDPGRLRGWIDLYPTDVVRLINMYGITETTVHVTFGPLAGDVIRQADGSSPIGRPLPETTVYVCNANLRLQPIGAVGEMYVGGSGVSRGYLNRDDLTAERFFPSPFRPGERLYKSGDLGRWTDAGTLEHWGRNDSQVQIRGFRVELGEVERAVLAHPQIRSAGVVAVGGEGDVQELAAYVVEAAPVEVADLRRRIAQQVPDYMVPHYFVRVPELPLTFSGKLDRKALPDPRGAAAGLQDTLPPRTPAELQLAAVWRQVLGLEFVGMNSNFFALGGDSLKAIRVVNRLAGGTAAPIGIKDVFRFPTIGELARLIEPDRPDRDGGGQPLGDASEHHERPSPPPAHPEERRLPAFAPLVRQRGETPAPLSRAQRRLWFLDQAIPGSPVYNVFRAVRIDGPLDVDALQASLNEIIRRHEVLRTTFPTVAGRPQAVVHKNVRLSISVDELAQRTSSQPDLEVQRRCDAEIHAPFDLATGPLVRFQLLRLAPREHVAILTFHHIVCDGWSINVVLDELAQLYQAFSAGRSSPLPELPIQYGDFACWQEEWLAGEAADWQRQWWRSQLGDWTLLDLPTDRSRPAEPDHRGAVHVFAVGPEPLTALRALAREEGATPYMTLLALFFVLLHRYSGQEDIVVGTPVANRNRPETEPLIGFFVNSLVMRCDLSGRPGLRTVLRRVREFALQAYDHQDFPFDELVKAVAPDRDTAGNPIFQVMFSLENETAGGLELPGLAFTPIELESRLAKFDLLLNFTETAEGLIGALEYSTDLFWEDTIRRMAEHFVSLLQAGVSDPDRDVGTLLLMSEAERNRLLVKWNDTERSFPADEPIHRLFESQAAQSPDAVAIEFGRRVLTYRQLDRLADGIGRRLRQAGVEDQAPVAIYARRSTEMIAGLLGILKAGGYYVPLDTSYPQQRLALMLEDCGASVLLTQREIAGNLPKTSCQMIWLDDEPTPDDDSRAIERTRPQVGGDRLAYVIYTSGSTGQPKGVAVPHRAVVRLVRNTNYIEVQPDDVIAQASNASFDAATFEIWGALLNGARLVGVDRDVTLSPPEFVRFLRQHRVTTLFLTTALFNQMARDVPDGFATLRHVLFGGEAVDPQWVRQVLRRGPPQRLLHVYGPTENTTFSTWNLVRVVPEDATTVPIGAAISNTQLYVLDSRLQPVPIGVPGELYVGGAGLARGYLNRRDLTDECFLPSPFQDGGRLYKTGDAARWLPSGDLEFIGRRDHQVKIRGFRIELGEVEAWLSRHPRVREAVVIAREDRPGVRELVAYIVVDDAATGAREVPAERPLAMATARPGLVPAGDSSLLESQLRADMAQDLPGYMVPARFLFLDRLPLNANGKVDRRTLPAPPELSREPDRALDAPRNELEQAMVDAWRSVLGGRKLGVNDNYFHLGGDSIIAIQLVSHLRQAGWELSVRDLFEHPTVRSLAPILQRREARGEPSQEAVSGPVPLTPIQRWFFDEHAGDLHHFNQAVLLRSAERLDAAALRQVLHRLWEHHDALRMIYSFRGAAVSQSAGGIGGSPGFELVDLQHEQDESASLQAHADRVQGSFDLQRGPLLKAVLFRLQQSDRLLLVIHHLAVDGVSWRILLEDLRRGYGQWLQGEPVKFYPKTDSFQRWAQQLQRLADSQSVLADLGFWSSVLDQDAPAFPPDTVAEGPNRYGDSETVHTSLSSEETKLLLTETHQAYDTEVNDLLLTALGRALSDRHESRHALIALEGHGREQLDVELDLSRTVGWFTCWYPFLLPMGEGSLGEQIQAVRQALRGVPQRGLSFGILRYLTPPPLASGVHSACRAQLSFNYLGQFEGGDDSGLSFAPESSGRAISPRLVRVHDLDVIGIVTDGRLSLSITYHPHRHRRESVQLLLDAFRTQLRLVAEHCRNIGPRQTASREYTFSQLPADDFDRILQSLE